MSKEKHSCPDEDDFPASIALMKDILCNPPYDVAEVKRFKTAMQSKMMQSEKEQVTRTCLLALEKGKEYLTNYLAVENNPLSSMIKHFCPNKLDVIRKRNYDRLLDELIKTEKEINNKKKTAWLFLDGLMEEISICVNLQKKDYPDSLDSFGIIRDVDSSYGQLSRPVPLSIHFYVFMLLCNCIDIVDLNIRASDIQRNIIALFDNTNANIEQLREEYSKKTHEIKDAFHNLSQNLFDTLSRTKQEINDSMWNATNCITVKINKSDIKKRTFKLNQKDIAKHIRIGFLAYCKEHGIKDIKAPGEPTVISILNKWNGYIKANDKDKAMKEGDKPFPEYESIIYSDLTTVELWTLRIFAERYIDNMRKRKNEKDKRKEEKRKKEGQESTSPCTTDALARLRVDPGIIDSCLHIENKEIYFDEKNDDEDDDEGKKTNSYEK